MRRYLCALLIAPLLGGAHARDNRGPGGYRPQSATASAPAPATGSAKIWAGRHAEFEADIRAAEIDHFEDVPLGVTHPRRAFLKPGGLVASVAWKALPPSRRSGYRESYKSEIAAYELDKLLGLLMVPVAVEKRWKGETAAAILWLTPIHSWKEMQARVKPERWNLEAIRMKMFDNLTGTRDRNAGNLLVDDDWHLFLIDHSRAFTDDKGLVVKMTRIDRGLWDRMVALDEPTLAAALGPWLDRAAIRAMLARRDRMKAAIAAMVQRDGAAAVFVDSQ